MAAVKTTAQTDLIGEEDKYSMFRMATQMPADKGCFQLHFPLPTNETLLEHARRLQYSDVLVNAID